MREFRSIGFVGLGAMGEPMCRNLANGHDGTVIGFDLRPEPLTRLGEDGVRAMPSLAALAAEADLILLSLPGGDEVRAVCLGEDGLIGLCREGQVVVDTSTAPPALSRELHARFAARGIAFADAPIARMRQAAIEGKLSIMVGGEAALFGRIEPVLRHMASDVTHCGDVGSGEICKILNNMVLFENVMALSEALAIGRRAGMDGTVLFETIAKSSGDSFALRNHGMKAVLPDAFPKGAFSVRYALKDLGYALELAEQGALEARGAALVKDLFESAIETGWGELYHPVIKRVIDSE